jgi:hypothetical protein
LPAEGSQQVDIEGVERGGHGQNVQQRGCRGGNQFDVIRL